MTQFQTLLRHRFVWAVIALFALAASGVPVPNASAQGNQIVDLAVAALAAPSPVAPGKLLSYRVTIGRDGRRPAENVKLEMAVPSGTLYVDATGPRDWTITPAQPGTTLPVTATIPQLAPGRPETFLITFRVGPQAPPGSTIDASITLSTTSVDSNPANNIVQVSTPVAILPPPVADLAVYIDALQEPVTQGNLMILMIGVANSGPMAATDVVLHVPTPDGVVFEALASSQGDAETPVAGGTGDITVSLDVVPTNKVAFVTLVTMVTADPGVFITAVAGVTSSSDDPNTANNVNRSTTRVVQNGPPADLVLEFDQPPTAVIAGTIVPFTVKVTNNGPSDISSATVLVPVPRNTRYLATTVSQGSDPRTPPIGKPGAVAWRPGLLTPGASATMTVSLGIAGRAGTRVFASALVTSGADDSNLENNTSTTSARVQSLGDVAIQWDPPDASGDNAPPQNVTVTPSSTGPPAKTDATAATRDGSGDVLCYNVYSSNTQPVATTPENLLTTVPPNETVYDGSAAPGGSFFTVTAQYPEGESGAANTAGTGDTPGPTIDTWKVTSTKVTATGSGFSTTVEVLFDGIPFADLSKVKKSNTKVVQKGSLVIAQTVDQYTAGGGSFLIIFRNEDGGVTTVTYTKQ